MTQMDAEQPSAIVGEVSLEPSSVILSEARYERSEESGRAHNACAVEWRAADREAARLALRLPRRSALRWLNADLEQPVGQRLEDVGSVLEVLENGRRASWRERAVAAWLLGAAELPEADRERAAMVLGLLLSRRLKSGEGAAVVRSVRWAAIVPLLVALLFVGLYGRAAADGGPLMADVAVLTLLTGVVASLAFFVTTPAVVVSSAMRQAVLEGRVRAQAALALSRLASPVSIAPLAWAAAESNPKVRAYAADGLKRLLPTLGTEQYGQLEMNAVPALAALSHHPDEELVLCVLAGLERFGDGRAVYAAEAAARDPRRPAVRAAAERALPVLRERQRRERDPMLLLRAASGPDATLLRPAATTAEADPAVLLRPGASPAEDGKDAEE